MGPLDDLDIGYVAAMAAAVFVATAGAVVLTGFLPRSSGPPAGRGLLGGALVYGSVSCIAGLLVMSFAAALALHWAVVIVIAGCAFLAAPFAVEPLPGHVRESRLALVTVSTLAGLMILVLSGVTGTALTI